MVTPAERVFLVIADISGYTDYLAGSEIEHAQDILADLLETIVTAMGPVLRLAKLEGDAIFSYAPEAAIDASLFLDALETCYFAFRRRIQSACRTIPSLNLKFCARHGAVLRHRVAGHEELAGTDAILVHRLLKNSISERFGLHGYAMLTGACVEALGINPAVLGMMPRTVGSELALPCTVSTASMRIPRRSSTGGRFITLRGRRPSQGSAT